MRIHIWCPRASNSALAIRNYLRSREIRANKTRANLSDRGIQNFLRRVSKGDLWINWGSPGPCPRGIKALNSATFLNKCSQLVKLNNAKVPCLEVSNRPQEGWIGRSINHQEGKDLINGTGRDYWTKKLAFSRELRIHIYKGKSIHAGLKVPRPSYGKEPHPWIRSYNTGWMIDYSRAGDIAQDRRTLASKAVEALGLDFGAVDLGVVKGNDVKVIEVNTAPGLDEGPSVECYVKHFIEELRLNA